MCDCHGQAVESKRLVQWFHAGTVGDSMILASTRADAFDLSCLTAGSAALMRHLGRSNRWQVIGEQLRPTDFFRVIHLFHRYVLCSMDILKCCVMRNVG